MMPSIAEMFVIFALFFLLTMSGLFLAWLINRGIKQNQQQQQVVVAQSVSPPMHQPVEVPQQPLPPQF